MSKICETQNLYLVAQVSRLLWTKVLDLEVHMQIQSDILSLKSHFEESKSALKVYSFRDSNKIILNAAIYIASDYKDSYIILLERLILVIDPEEVFVNNTNIAEP